MSFRLVVCVSGTRGVRCVGCGCDDWLCGLLSFCFQAEDGIRDAALVTGVQTCALPISKSKRRVSGCTAAVWGTFSRIAVWQPLVVGTAFTRHDQQIQESSPSHCPPGGKPNGKRHIRHQTRRGQDQMKRIYRKLWRVERGVVIPSAWASAEERRVGQEWVRVGR